MCQATNFLMSSVSFVSAAGLWLEALPSSGASFIVSHFLPHEVFEEGVCVFEEGQGLMHSRWLIYFFN